MSRSDTNTPDIRWKQRFNNFLRAYASLQAAVELSHIRALSDLEKQGLIQAFEYTHELAWNVLKDYLEKQGFVNIVGSKNAACEAFKQGFINNGQVWMDMMTARNKTVHTYLREVADQIFDEIVNAYAPAFAQFSKAFNTRFEQE